MWAGPHASHHLDLSSWGKLTKGNLEGRTTASITVAGPESTSSGHHSPWWPSLNSRHPQHLCDLVSCLMGRASSSSLRRLSPQSQALAAAHISLPSKLSPKTFKYVTWVPSILSPCSAHSSAPSWWPAVVTHGGDTSARPLPSRHDKSFFFSLGELLCYKAGLLLVGLLTSVFAYLRKIFISPPLLKDWELPWWLSW